MYSERLFRRPNNDFGERFFAFKPLIYQKMDLGKIDAREAQVFAWTTTKYVVTSTD